MFLAALTVCALGQSSAPMPVTELAANVKAVAPGKPFVVGLHMKLPAGWHNYYANPGESGVPTTITWTLPSGYTAGPIQWPVPELLAIDGVNMFGYTGDVWLTSTITPPSKAALGPLTLKAKADWLLCAAECVPQSANLELKLSVAKKSIAAASVGLSAALKALPSHALPWSTSAVATNGAVQLAVQNPTQSAQGATFFPSDPESFMATAAKFTKVPEGFQLLMPLSRYATKAPTRLTGILKFPKTGKSYWVDIPVAS